jgi:Ribbon-helix-helix protein, copG family
MNEMVKPQPPAASEQAADRKTARKEVKLKIVPTRLTLRQFERLDELRNSEGLSMQDHIRRAIDVYLEAIARKARRDEPAPTAGAAVHAPPSVAKAADTGVQRGKVVYR